MRKFNEQNERIKRQYLIFLKEAKGQDEASLDKVAAALLGLRGGARVQALQGVPSGLGRRATSAIWRSGGTPAPASHWA